MTAPYRDADPVRSGQTLRDLERRRRVVTGEEWLPFDVLPVPPDEEPTLVMDWAGLRSLSLADQARAATSPRALVRWPADDSALPYASTVRRRFRQRGAWIRVWQDRMGSFQDIALALLIACLLIALWLVVVALGSLVAP